LIDLLAKQIIAPALYTVIGGSSRPFETSGDLMEGAIQRLVDRAIEGDEVQTSTHSDLLQTLVNVSNVASVPDWPQSARRLSISSSWVPARLSRSTFLTTNAATGKRKCDREW
jgi:hypothetical protein